MDRESLIDWAIGILTLPLLALVLIFPGLLWLAVVIGIFGFGASWSIKDRLRRRREFKEWQRAHPEGVQR